MGKTGRHLRGRTKRIISKYHTRNYKRRKEKRKRSEVRIQKKTVEEIQEESWNNRTVRKLSDRNWKTAEKNRDISKTWEEEEEEKNKMVGRKCNIRMKM